MSTLVVQDIAKTFKGRKVVQGVSFTVESGHVVGLLGPNGAGKTTSFYMVVGLISTEAGDILLDGESIGRLSMYLRAQKGISYLPQEPSIFRKLTVRENIMAALEIQIPSRGRRNERLEQLVADFGLEHIVNSYGYSLSGGERRRVEIARSLAGFPKFLLLDEPFAGIDPIAVNEIQKIIRKLKEKGIGILITDHNVRETLEICDIGYIMKEGQVKVQGTPKEITESPIARKYYLGENFRLGNADT
ncbi:MAG: LPS export ABC transporter ATP-binding protein [Bdellovibrionaceae bacterium]|nr:LPS export ABC transporter ATP-binding protein [Pseudobdellovibrionaceae bacterium]